MRDRKELNTGKLEQEAEKDVMSSAREDMLRSVCQSIYLSI